ncbi:MAG: heat-inducible transcriptional repressor HrcA [Peptococcaceae bacterium]|jgi:heat-inducible transcriptional repressor|nr:heat-inducible transcriptional repressor HrcA [Peptococcaceae bacterium]
MQLDERKKRILYALIQDYVATAEPVGSRTIARKFDLGISSATIRNEMADLEDLGLIEQPHTSAGRIPSDVGYRYYVDCLLEPLELSRKNREMIEREAFGQISVIEEVITQTGNLLSKLTNLTSIVLTPKKGPSRSHLSQVHFLPYQPGQAIMVVVQENGTVENHIIEVEESVTQDELQLAAQVLTYKMKGYSLEDIKKSVLHEIYNELNRQKKLIDTTLEMMEIFFSGAPDHDKVYLGGTLNMLNQPEFRDLAKVKDLFKIFEQDDNLKKVIDPSRNGLRVTIGGENNLAGLQGCSVIYATYQENGENIGSIGVLGPTRMDYASAMAIVDYMTKKLTDILSKPHR